MQEMNLQRESHVLFCFSLEKEIMSQYLSTLLTLAFNADLETSYKPQHTKRVFHHE